jgi:hypothetical protein
MVLCITGCVKRFRIRLFSMSSNITCPSLSRLRVESSLKTSSPKCSLIFFQTGLPGSTTKMDSQKFMVLVSDNSETKGQWNLKSFGDLLTKLVILIIRKHLLCLDMRSALITGMSNCANTSQTLVFPQAIPPRMENWVKDIQ